MLTVFTIPGVRVITVAVAVLIAVMSLLPSELAASLVKEHGPVEAATAAGFFIGAGWLLIRSIGKKSGDAFSASLIILLLGLRELDFHARFTTMGVFKTRYYISPEVPAGEKMVVTVIMIGLIILVWRFLLRHSKPFFSSLREGEKGAVVLALAIGSGILAKTMDSMSGPLRKAVGVFHSDPRTCLRVAEETIELAIPMFICLAVYYYIAARK